jgi:hypothetical protein
LLPLLVLLWLLLLSLLQLLLLLLLPLLLLLLVLVLVLVLVLLLLLLSTEASYDLQGSSPCCNVLLRQARPQLWRQGWPVSHLHPHSRPTVHRDGGREACEQWVILWRLYPCNHCVCCWARHGCISHRPRASQKLGHHLPFLLRCSKKNLNTTLPTQSHWQLMYGDHSAPGWGSGAAAEADRDAQLRHLHIPKLHSSPCCLPRYCGVQHRDLNACEVFVTSVGRCPPSSAVGLLNALPEEQALQIPAKHS